MSIVRQVLKVPHTVAALLILLCLLGIGAALRIAARHLSGDRHPGGECRVDLQRHERHGYPEPNPVAARAAAGIPGRRHRTDRSHELRRCGSRKSIPARGRGCQSSGLAARLERPRSSQVHAAQHHSATGVALWRDGRTHHPTEPFEPDLPDTKLNDLGQNIIRPALAVVHGAEVPQPYGGKPRVIMADIDSEALAARGLSPAGHQRRLAAAECHIAVRRREDREQGLPARDE